jgi:hypothetical protein
MFSAVIDDNSQSGQLLGSAPLGEKAGLKRGYASNNTRQDAVE